MSNSSKNNASFRGNVTTADGGMSRELLQWMQQIIDQPLGQTVVTDTGIPPGIKKWGTIIWRDTLIDKTYIVHYDGTDSYYWLCTGKNLY